MAAASRTEVEVLMKMRAEGQEALDLFSGGLGTVAKEGEKAAKATDDVEKKTKSAGAAAAAAGTALGLLADRAIRSVVGGFGAAIDSATRLDAALLGLDSVAKGMGVSVDSAREAAKSLAADGLMTVSEAAEGLKNLLATGFSLPEAIQLMDTFRDSAAFNRQGMLGFGEAVVRATQGIKFNNSALTDSTGLGKNLSKIMTDAGLSMDAAGNAAQDAGVRQAILNGFVKEGAIFAGNAAKYSESNAGATAQMGAAAEKASAAIGKELQPAVRAFSAVALPLLGLVEKYPGVFLAAGLAIGGMAAPILAVRAAALLGLPSLTGLAGGVTTMARAFGAANLSTTISQLGGIAGVSGTAGTAVGLLGTAAAAAGVAFLSWKVGKWLGEVTGLTSAVERAAVRIKGVTEASVPLEQQQKIVNLAIQKGAEASISYADAMTYLTRVAAVRRGEQTNSTAAKREAIQAELELGRITKEQAATQLAAIAAQEQATAAAEKRRSMTEALANAEKKIRDEIASTGQTIPQLTAALKTNESAFEAWAEKAGLSKDTISFLKDKLKEQTEAQKKANDVTEDAKKKADQQRQALEQLGIVTKDRVNEQLREFAELEKRAVAEGVPMDTVLRTLRPRLEELATTARQSGVDVSGVTEQIKRADEATQRWIATLPRLPVAAAGAFPIIGQQIQLMNGEQLKAYLQTKDLEKANKEFGTATRAELQKTADESTRLYQVMLASGKYTPERIAVAFEKMQKDVAAAQGKIPSQWETEIVPGIKGSLSSLSSAFSGTLADMLLGTKGFGEGWKDIWGSLKQTATDILGDILNYFINSFIKGMIGTMLGQKGAFASAFGQMTGGAGGSGGLAGLFGGSGGGAGSGGLGGLFGGGGSGGAGGAAGAAAQGGTNWGALLGGGAMAVGGGIGLYKSLKSGSKLGATLSGAQTGAGIGTMIMPGIGTAIGAGVGALGGFVSSLFGKGAGRKKVEAFGDQFGGLDALHEQLGQSLKPDEAESLWVNLTQKVGKGDEKAAEAAINAIVKALQDADAKLQMTSAAAAEFGLTWEDMSQKVRQEKITETADGLLKKTTDLTAAGYEYDKVIGKQAASYSALYAKASELGTKLPAELQPVLAKLIEMGLLTDANGEKITELGADMFDAARPAITEFDKLGKGIKGLGDVADAATTVIRDRFGRLRVPAVTIPYRYEQEGDGPPSVPTPGLPDGEGENTPGGAASGIYAKNPTLAIFGEGGEPEVGGPKSFFADVFRSLGISGSGGGDGDGAINLTFHVTTLSGADELRTAVETDIVPMILDAIRWNRRQARTDFRSFLGVTNGG